MLVGSNIAAALNSLPDNVRVVGVRHLEDPAVVEADRRAGVATEDEDLVLRLRFGAKADGSVLRTRAGQLVALLGLFLPEAILCKNEIISG